VTLSVIVIFGRYFNLNGWSGKLAAGMLAAAVLLLALAAIETIRQKVKGRSHGVDQNAVPAIDPEPENVVVQDRESTDLHQA